MGTAFPQGFPRRRFRYLIMASALRQTLRRALLRGPLATAWVTRRGRQMDRAYGAHLRAGLNALAVPAAAPAVGGAGGLRQILLIADVLWEQHSLVPELSRIAPTQLLDLHPALEIRSSATTEPQRVARAIADFAAAQRGSTPDVVLFYARPALLSDEVFATLRRAWSGPLLGLNLDDKLQFFPCAILADHNDDYARWAGKFDLNLTSCLLAADWYRQRGFACLYMPPGLHQAAHLSPPERARFDYQISFAGTERFERRVLIAQLQQVGISIQLFGRGWPGAKWVENLPAVFRASQLNLGVGFPTPSQTLTNLKGRDFECPGAGACYLTTYNWELPLHFELGKEMLCYRSVEELIELYAYYVKRPEECLRIAQAAWRRCAAEHTWEKRFRNIFRHIGFKV